MQKQRQKKKKIQAKSTELTPHLRKIIRETDIAWRKGNLKSYRANELDQFFKDMQ